MGLKFIIIGGIIFIILFVLILFIIISKKKISKVDFKIEDALDYINEYLENKLNLIKESRDICKNKNYLDNFEDEDFSCESLFKLNDLLSEFEEKFNAELYDDEELAKNKDTIEFINKLKENNINLKASINYYNDKVKAYYDLKYTFPISFVKLFCGFKKFDLFNEKKD